MRRLIVLLPAVALLALATTASGQYISGSAHDFSGTAWADQICEPCHTPHHAYPYGDETVTMVLWNHDETDQTFTMYTTLAGNTGTLDGTSKLCLSCHDGVTAVDNYGGSTGGTVFTTTGSLGTDLSNDHPIGVQYPPEDGGGTPLAGYNDPPTGNVKLVTVASVDRVECSSCHDPHGTANTKFLRDPITASAICLKCHNK